MGEWTKEPNELDFESNGLQCRIRRIQRAGHLCGYVGLPMNHKFANKSYNDEPLYNIEVHGGLTFADKFKNSDLWWFGFDCAHLGDFIPFHKDTHDYNSSYKNISYVKSEVERLAKQLSEL